MRLHGLNSALNSDEGDQIANLYLAPYQTQQLDRESGVTELLLCHHPPNWLIDKTDVEGAIHSFVRVALFGHEHNHRVQRIENTVQLFAGAVQPAARDPDWLPTYHILQLHVEGTGDERKLVVRIYSRELRMLSHLFVPRMSAEGNVFEERKVDLPRWAPPSEDSSQERAENVACPFPETQMVDNEQPIKAVPPAAFRELLVNFHRLSTPIRYKIATELGLLRDGDDLPPQQQWDLIFRRARDEGRLAELWRAVCANDNSFAKRPNPFDR